jgi:5,10-methylenetetrahydromethanopterin reductase
MEADYRASGRDPARKRKTIFSFGSVLKEGESYDSPRVKAEAGPVAMVMLHNAMEQQNHGSLTAEFESSTPPNPALDQIVREYRNVYESYAPADARYLTLHKGHLMFVRPEEDRFATGDLIRAMTVTATAPELRDRMRRLQEAGYDEVAVQITPGCETMIDDWARVFERI